MTTEESVSPASKPAGALVPSQRRLQRPPDFTGARLDSFRAVALRHGLPGLLLGLTCLLHPALRETLATGLASASAQPLRYLTIGVAIFAGLLLRAWFLDRKLDAPAIGWIVYLGCLSAWEEWVFRLALPTLFVLAGVEFWLAIVASNLAFGVVHYFTLRWKWSWCLGAFVGGLALSRQYGLHEDLALLIAIHWVATFFNTPRRPYRSGSAID